MKSKKASLPFLSLEVPFFVGSQAQFLRSPCEQALVMACTTPADDTAYTKAASREPTVQKDKGRLKYSRVFYSVKV